MTFSSIARGLISNPVSSRTYGDLESVTRAEATYLTARTSNRGFVLVNLSLWKTPAGRVLPAFDEDDLWACVWPSIWMLLVHDRPCRKPR